MPSERLTKCFADTLAAILLIETWVHDAGGVEQATHDVLVHSAIERQLLIISEAAIRMDKLDPAGAAQLAPGIDWPGVRGIGNFIRHKYDDLDTTVVTDALANRLEPLKQACRVAMQTLADKG